MSEAALKEESSIVTARSEKMSENYVDEARTTSFTKTPRPKAFNKKERL